MTKKIKQLFKFVYQILTPKDISYIFENDYIDHVLNFSALKHVRSEEHNLSLKRMIDTNVLSIEKLIKLAIKYRVKVFSQFPQIKLPIRQTLWAFLKELWKI